jgi:glycosyl transferase family 25
MIEIFVVSLSSATERRKALEQRMDELGLRFRYFAAVDGRGGLPQRYEYLVDRPEIQRRLGRPMTGSELGCALSHVFVYEAIMAEGLEEAIILEDDMRLSDDFAELVRSVRVGELGKDLVLLYHNSGFGFRASFRPAYNDYQSFSFAALPSSTGAYYISRRGAETLYRGALPISYVADWPLLIPFRMRTAGVFPRPAMPTPGPTQIEGRRLLGKAKKRPKGFWRTLFSGKFREALDRLYFQTIIPRFSDKIS